MKEPLNRLHLYKDIPRFWDAWEIDSNYRLQEIEAAYDVEMGVVEQGLEAVLKLTECSGTDPFTCNGKP